MSQTTDPDRQLACMLGQHIWMPDDEDIRFRICIYCETVQYLGKDVKDASPSKPKKRT